MPRLLPILFLFACGGDVAADMERSLRLGNDAIALGLLAAEGVAWVDARDSGYRRLGDITHGSDATPPGGRHGIPTDCPKLDRDPDEGFPFTVAASYGNAGCVSGSGLVPSTLLGWIYVSGDADTLTVDATDVEIGLARAPEGLLAGTRVGQAERYSVSGELSLPDTPLLAAIAGDVHLEIDHSVADEVLLDGHIDLETDLGDARVDLEEVRILIEDVSGECPVPYRGTARIDAKPEVSIDFRGANDDARVLVTRGRRTSTPTRLCSFASDVF